MSTETKLVVRRIIQTSPDGKHAQVTVARELFDQLRGFRPVLKYTTARNEEGKGVRVFDIDGTKLYARYVRDEQGARTVFTMEAADAQKFLSTLEAERANEPKIWSF